LDQARAETPVGDNERASNGTAVETWQDEDGDAAAFVEAAPQLASTTFGNNTVRDVMTRAIDALPPDATWREAADLMRRHQVHRVLVMDGERLVGLVSAMDIARAVADGRVTARTYVFDRTSQGRPEGSRSSPLEIRR